MKPMLAKNYDGDPDSAIRDINWALELKLNGRRLLVEGTVDGKLRAYNSDGDRTDVPTELAKELAPILPPLGAAFDGELMKDGRFWVFDMPHCGSLVDERSAWEDRRLDLEVLFDMQLSYGIRNRCVRLLPVARTTARKRAMAKKIWNNGYEGYILKRTDSPYTPGERSTTWRKVKNVRTVDCIVAGFGTKKHNIQLEVFHEGVRVPIGECSRLEGEAPKAELGDVLEVAFLDAGKPEKPRLCQPHAKRLRDDRRPETCLLDQLDGCWARKDVLV